MDAKASNLLILAGVAAVAITAALVLLRRGKSSVPGWLCFSLGVGSLLLLALLELTGRLGPEHLWFREPSFYLALVVLACSATWWLRRPARPTLRFGLPLAVLAGIACTVMLARLSGHSAPLAVLLPTLDARAPELSYFDTSGHKRTLADLHGQVVLLNFWATWCTPCRREMPMLSKLQRDHANQGLVVLYVSLEDAEVLAPFLAHNHFDGITGRLDRAADFYDAGRFYPSSFLITRDGRVAHRWSGRPREAWLEEQVVAQL